MKFEVFIMYALKSIKVYKTLLNSNKTIRSHKNLVVIDSYCPIGIYFRVYIYFFFATQLGLVFIHTTVGIRGMSKRRMTNV